MTAIPPHPTALRMGSPAKFDEIINKKLLNRLIKATEELFQYIDENPTARFEGWHKKVIGDNLRELNKLRQKLGYED